MPAKTATKKKTTTTAKTATNKTALKAVTKASTTKKPANTSVKPASKTTAKKTPSKTVSKPAAKAVSKKTTSAPAKTVKTPVKETAKVAAKTVKAAAPAKEAAKTPKNDNNAAYEFKAGDKVVYPAHGVGLVEGIETLTVAGTEVTLYTITFTKDRMRLKLPMQKVHASGLRRLADKDQLAEVFQTMKGRSRIRRVMWSRRAQEYEAKINSGNPVQVAEVLRDLRRNVSSTEHSYSERQIFQQALERLASELAAIEDVAQDTAAEKLQTLLAEAA